MGGEIEVLIEAESQFITYGDFLRRLIWITNIPRAVCFDANIIYDKHIRIVWLCIPFDSVNFHSFDQGIKEHSYLLAFFFSLYELEGLIRQHSPIHFLVVPSCWVFNRF